MTAGTAFYPKPPPGHWLYEAIMSFVKKYDPRTLYGALLYAGMGLAIGILLGGLR